MRFGYLLVALLLVTGCGSPEEGTSRTGVEVSATALTTTSATTIPPQADNEPDGNFTDFLGEYTLSDEDFGTQVSVVINQGTRVITTNALPDHETGDFPNSGNPNRISAQKLVWEFPSEPLLLASPVEVRVTGVAINGIKFEPGTAESVQCESGEVYRVEGLQDSFDLGMDFNNAHVQPTGEYHYHGLADALVEKYGDSDDLVLIGFAADGRLLYHSQSGQWASGYVLSDELRSGANCELSLPGSDSFDLEGTAPDGTYVSDWIWSASNGDLDECNGVVIDGEYVYLITDDYPFIPRCLRGEVTERDATTPEPPGGNGSPPRDGMAGPQSPPCGNVDVTTSATIAGVSFAPGTYRVHAFGIACDEVLGETGILARFLALQPDEPLPVPWRYLEEAVGAPKFVAGPATGFRIQRINP